MRTHYSLLLLVALAACPSGGATNPQPGDATLLAGDWDLVVHLAGQDDLLGVIALAPSDTNDTTVPVFLRGGTLEGRFQFRNRAWLPDAPGSSGVSAFIDADSAVTLYVRLQGRCGNCGNLGFAGRLAGDRVTGHWIQEYGITAPEGRFVLRRLGAK